MLETSSLYLDIKSNKPAVFWQICL